MVKFERDEKLRLYYENNDIHGMLPISEERKWDVFLLFYVFTQAKLKNNNCSLVKELMNRGYDIRTINFSIEKLKEDEENPELFLGENHIDWFPYYIEGIEAEGFRNILKTKDTIIFEGNFNSSKRLTFNLDKDYYWTLKIEDAILSVSELQKIQSFLDYLNAPWRESHDAKDYL